MKSWVYWTISALTVVAVCVSNHLYGYELTTLWLAGVTLPVSLTFIWLYATDGWEKTWFGRSLMLLAVAVLAYTVAVVMFRSFGDYQYRGALLLFATAGTFLAMLIRTMVLWSVKSIDRNKLNDRKWARHE